MFQDRLPQIPGIVAIARQGKAGVMLQIASEKQKLVALLISFGWGAAKLLLLQMEHTSWWQNKQRDKQTKLTNKKLSINEQTKLTNKKLLTNKTK